MATKKKGKAVKKTKVQQIFTDEELRDLKILKKWKVIECVSFIFGERFFKPEEWEGKSIVKRFVRILTDEFDVRENSSSEMTIPRGEFIYFVRSAKLREWFISNNVRATSEVRKIFMEVGNLNLREKEDSFLKMKYEEKFVEEQERLYSMKNMPWDKIDAYNESMLDDSQKNGKSINRGGRPGIDNEKRREAILKFKNTKYDTPERRRLIKYKVEISRALAGLNEAIPVDYSDEEYKYILGFKPSTVDKYVKKILNG
jgi:hypothetical protein